jgi:hypothetical protein
MFIVSIQSIVSSGQFHRAQVRGGVAGLPSAGMSGKLAEPRMAADLY